MISINLINKISHRILFLLTLGIIFIYNNIYAQGEKTEKITGVVTYISSQSVYVQFDNSEPIAEGDTLYLVKNDKEIPAIIVKYKSSRSCAGISISRTEIKLNDKIIAHINKPAEKEFIKEKTPAGLISEQNKLTLTSGDFKGIKNNFRKNNFAGRISIQSMTNLTNTNSRDEFQRWRYTVSLNADSISQSPLSFSMYSFFAYNTRDWSGVKSNIGRALKIYNFSLSYKFQNKSQLWFGRHLNYKTSNIGAIDGIQYQHQLQDFYIGGIIGSHPDFSDYGYNIKMFEYGAYIGRADTISSYSQMENTIAFFNQTNNFTTDRRYAYFQHTDNIIKGTNFFASTEIDLYKKIAGVIKNEPTLTSLFFSLYLNPASFISLGLSYDARRNVVYYETYKSFIDSLFTNEMRQGYRVNLNLRPLSKIFISLSGGYRFQKSDAKPSRNFGANLYYSSIPLLDAGAGISYTKLISSYTEGSITGLRLSKFINSLNLNLSCDLRRIEYKFSYNNGKLLQNSISADMSFALPLNLYFGFSYEGIFEKQNTYSRFFIDITKRF